MIGQCLAIAFGNNGTRHIPPLPFLSFSSSVLPSLIGAGAQPRNGTACSSPTRTPSPSSPPLSLPRSPPYPAPAPEAASSPAPEAARADPSKLPGRRQLLVEAGLGAVGLTRWSRSHGKMNLAVNLAVRENT
uniref:Uncharacterized protein n=1 Tax=Fagus sylvatica TaxID=28930 RepID=A0A2N9HEH5_FAGSY